MNSPQNVLPTWCHKWCHKTDILTQTPTHSGLKTDILSKLVKTRKLAALLDLDMILPRVKPRKTGYFVFLDKTVF